MKNRMVFLALILLSSYCVAEPLGMTGRGQRPHSPIINYTTITGFFAQDEPNANSTQIGPAPPRLGLLDTTPQRWRTFTHAVSMLNRQSPPNVTYKVFFLGRHGQGWHNVAEAHYGNKAWDDYWSRLNGNGSISWGPDAHLTELGEQQAQDVNARWKSELPLVSPVNGDAQTTLHLTKRNLASESHLGAPLPQRLFSSPLSRAIHTMQIAYGDIVMQPFGVKPLIVENLREVIGIHTCDQRRSRSYLSQTFPGFDIEHGFSEEDELWKPDARESNEENNARVKGALDQIFDAIWDKETYVAITAHGGTLRAAFHAFKHQDYAVSTGGIVPVLVKATRREKQDGAVEAVHDCA